VEQLGAAEAEHQFKLSSDFFSRREKKSQEEEEEEITHRY